MSDRLSALPRPLRLHLLVAAFYLLLAFILLYPLLLSGGRLVGGFDYFNYNWNFWWIRHALANGLNVYLNDFVMAPNAVNFGYHALTAFWFPLWALLEPLFGTLRAMQAVLLMGSFLNGYVLFLWLRREQVAPGLALLGGAALQISPVTRYFYYNNHINLMDWFWLPANLLLWSQTVRAVQARDLRRSLLWAVVHGVALWGVGHTDLQFPIFTAAWLGPYALWTLWRSGNRRRLMAAGLVTLVIAAALLWLAGPLPYMARFSGTLAPGSAEERPGIPFPRGYLSLDPVWWWWDTPTLGGSVTLLTLLALVAGLTRRRSRMPVWRWFWFALLVPPLLLSMGATITVLGLDIPMPFRALHALTNGMFRMPWRMAPIFVAGAAVFAGLTWTPLLRRRRAAMAGLSLVFLLMAADVRLYETPPVSQTFRWEQIAPVEPSLPAYDFYAAIGQERGPAYDRLVLLEVPTGVSTGEVIIGDARASQLQFYGMQHRKRMVNGFISRAPVEIFWPVNVDDPLLSWLGQRRQLELDTVEAGLRRAVDEWPLGYIVVHQDMIGRNSSTPQEIIGWLNGLDDWVCPWVIERDAVVYRTRAHPDGCPGRVPPEAEPGVYTVDIGTSGDERYLGWGWHWPEEVSGLTLRWTGQYPQTDLYVDLPPGSYQISLSVQSFWEPRRLTILANGLALGEAEVAVEGLQTLAFALPAEVVGQGSPLRLTLLYDAVIVPDEIGQSADPRPLAVAVDRIAFRRE